MLHSLCITIYCSSIVLKKLFFRVASARQVLIKSINALYGYLLHHTQNHLSEDDDKKIQIICHKLLAHVEMPEKIMAANICTNAYKGGFER